MAHKNSKRPFSRRSQEQKFATEHRRKLVSELFLQGKKHYEIAALLDVTVNTVTEDRKALRAEWQAIRVANMDEVVAEQLAKLELIEREAWIAYRRTCEKGQVIRVTDGEHGCTMIETREQTGDGKHHDTILKCVKQRRELLGLDAPVKSEVKTDVEYHHPKTREEVASLLQERLEQVRKSQK